MTILAIIIFILVFSFLILAHEWGHFTAARWAGAKIEEFGIGLPPRIWGWRKNKKSMLYSVNWIPFGGFVKIKGEGGDKTGDDDSLVSKSYGKRILVIIAGVLMNFIVAYILLMIGFWLGMPPLATDVSHYVSDAEAVNSRVLILNVDKDSPAEQAGILSGDVVTQINGQSLSTVDELQAAIAGQSQVTLVIDRGQESVEIISRTKTDEGRQIIGILADELIDKVRYVWWKVPYFALVELWGITRAVTVAIVGFVVSLVQTASVPDSVAGPVGIAKVTSQAIQLGFLSLLQFIIFLSINLGLINIFPFPALDGGRLVFLIVEVLRGGKRVRPEVEAAVHNFGFLLLLVLIFTITYKDIVRFF